MAELPPISPPHSWSGSGEWSGPPSTPHSRMGLETRPPEMGWEEAGLAPPDELVYGEDTVREVEYMGKWIKALDHENKEMETVLVESDQLLKETATHYFKAGIQTHNDNRRMAKSLQERTSDDAPGSKYVPSAVLEYARFSDRHSHRPMVMTESPTLRPFAPANLGLRREAQRNEQSMRENIKLDDPNKFLPSRYDRMSQMKTTVGTVLTPTTKRELDNLRAEKERRAEEERKQRCQAEVSISGNPSHFSSPKLDFAVRKSRIGKVNPTKGLQEILQSTSAHPTITARPRPQEKPDYGALLAEQRADHEKAETSHAAYTELVNYVFEEQKRVMGGLFG